jgi:hypothetical protein
MFIDCAYSAPALPVSTVLFCDALAHDQVLQHLVEPPCQYVLFCDARRLAPVTNPLQISHRIAPQYLLFCDGFFPLSPHP